MKTSRITFSHKDTVNKKLKEAANGKEPFPNVYLHLVKHNITLE